MNYKADNVIGSHMHAMPPIGKDPNATIDISDTTNSNKICYTEKSNGPVVLKWPFLPIFLVINSIKSSSLYKWYIEVIIVMVKFAR